ncbi:MAG: hypothetical protein Q7S76_02925 [bacterium]|nr:hypothetical protein [bacterium]
MFEKLRNTIRFWKYSTHPAKMEHRCRKTVLFGSHLAHNCFRDEEFRSLIRFDKHSEEEQNRLFNELTVTNIALLMLLIDQRVQETSEEFYKEYLVALRKAVPEFYSAFLRRINIPEALAKLWDQLVEMRYDEYSNDMLEFRRRFFDEENELAHEIASDNFAMIFQTVVLGLYSHLTRGKIKKGDPLYLFLQKYLVGVHKGLIKRI